MSNAFNDKEIHGQKTEQPYEQLVNGEQRLHKTKMKNVVLWIVQILGAAAFFTAGYLKFTGHAMMLDTFEQIGAGQWFLYFTGAIEIGGAILLLLPKVNIFGALLLAITMIGAVFTHLFLIGGSPIPALALLVLVSSIIWGRYSRLQPLFKQFYLKSQSA